MSALFCNDENIESAAIFEPTSNPASFAFNNPTVPVVTSLFVGPDVARFAVSVPDCTLEPFGRMIASAGSTASKSGAGMSCPFSLRLSAGVSPLKS